MQLRFGRDEPNGLRIGDEFASRRHGWIECRDGEFLLTDSSKNGTLIVRGNERILFVHGETVVLEGEGSIRLARLDGSRLTFCVEWRTLDGALRPHGSFPEAPVATPATRNVFRLEGEYWTIVFGGHVLRMKDARGLRFIRYLLANPDREFRAVDLAADVPAGMERGVFSRDASRDLSRVGATQTERARALVTMRIKGALQKLRQCHPTLERHLVANIRTGRCCTYAPDSTERVLWEL